MADLKISQLPSATTPLAGTEPFPIVQSGITKKATISDIITSNSAALTKTDDTNVTLTLGGSPTIALLAATSLTLGWTGTLSAARGGTGTGSYTVGDILYADTSSTLAKLPDIATGNVLLSGGVGTAPSWGKVSLSAAVSGILPIANGGTNATSQTANGLNYFDGTKITSSANATLSFIAGDVDLLITHPSVVGTAYEVVVTSSSCQYVMAYNTVSTFQGICGTGATENYWTLSTAGLGLYVSASSLWFGSTSNNDMSFYRNNTERLRLTTTGIYVPDVAYLSAASPTINTMVSGTSLIQSSVRLISAYSGAASANSSYFLGSGNDGGLLQVFGAGGTIASPTALTTDSRMGGLFGRGYAATGYSNAVAAVTFHAESTFTDTSTPTYIAFATTASGATTRTEAMRITSAGNLLIGTTSTSARITLGGSPVMQTLIRNDAVLTASGANANQYGFINYNNMTFIGGSTNYATGHYADLKVNVPGGATVIAATSIIAVSPTNLGAGSVTHAKAFQANAPTVGASSNIAAYLENVSIGSSFSNTTPPTNGALIQGNVAIATTDTSRRLVVAGVGATNDKLLYLRQTNDYGYSFNLDSSSSGRMYLYGVNAGVETSAIMTFDRTNTYVGVNATPSYRFHINENQAYSSRNANPLPAQLVVQSGASGFLKMGNYYTGGVGTCSAIQSTDLFSGADHGVNLLLNPLGGNVGVHTGTPTKPFHVYANVADHCSIIENVNASGYGLIVAAAIDPLRVGANGEYGGERFIVKADGKVGINDSAPSYQCVIRNQTTSQQLSIVYSGTAAANNKELQLGYNGATGSGYGWIQSIHNGTAYTALSLNPNGGNIGVGTSGPLAKFHVLETSGTDDVIFQRNGSGGTSDSIKIANDGTVSTITGDNEEFKISHSAGTYQYFKGGNFGIGKTDPQEKLDMGSGKIRFYSSTDYQNVFANTWGINVFTSKLTGSGLRIGEIYGNLGLYSGDGSTSYHLGLYAPTGYNVYLAPNSTVAMTLDSNGNVVACATSALATNATNGFLYIRTCAGTPTGAPTAFTGHVAMVYDTTNNKLYVYNGAWKSVTLA